MSEVESAKVDPRWRPLLLTVRQAIIMVLGALEDALDVKRTVPKRNRGGPKK